MIWKYILNQVLFWCDMAQLPELLCSCVDLYQLRILPSRDKCSVLCPGVLWGICATGWAHSKS